MRFGAVSALIIHSFPPHYQSLKFALKNEGRICEELAAASRCFAIPNKSDSVKSVEQ